MLLSTPPVTHLYTLSYIFYGVSLAGVSCAAHYSCPDNAIGLVAQCELSGYAKLGWLLEAVGRKFSHRPGNPATVGVVRWPSAGDTAGYRLRRPKFTPVSLISTTFVQIYGQRNRTCITMKNDWLLDTATNIQTDSVSGGF